MKATDFSHSRAVTLGLMISLCFTGFTSSGCGSGRKVPGLESFHADVMQSRLYVSFVSTTLKWDAGLTVPIPGLDDSTVSVAPDLNSAGTVFQFVIPLATLLNGGRALPLRGLPDGRGIPDIAGGMLPRWDFDVGSSGGSKFSASAYLSDDVFGLFIPLKFKTKKGVGLPFLISVEIKDERGNLLGKAYAIPQNLSGEGSGLLILLPFLGGDQGSGGLQ